MRNTVKKRQTRRYRPDPDRRMYCTLYNLEGEAIAEGEVANANEWGLGIETEDLQQSPSFQAGDKILVRAVAPCSLRPIRLMAAVCHATEIEDSRPTIGVSLTGSITPGYFSLQRSRLRRYIARLTRPIESHFRQRRVRRKDPTPSTQLNGEKLFARTKLMG